VPSEGPAQRAPSRTLRGIALLEAAKGALVLLAGFGLLSLVHRDVQRIAESLVRHAHLNPASHYPHIFVDAAAQLTDVRLHMLAAGAAAYALVRCVEACGLWHERRWAEWFAAITGAIYVPFELLEMFRHASWPGAGVLALNVLVVAFVLDRLRRRQPVPGGSGSDRSFRHQRPAQPVSTDRGERQGDRPVRPG
jgi:uncharacterized membrane protein (DUF2068 family)